MPRTTKNESSTVPHERRDFQETPTTSSLTVTPMNLIERFELRDTENTPGYRNYGGRRTKGRKLPMNSFRYQLRHLNAPTGQVEVHGPGQNRRLVTGVVSSMANTEPMYITPGIRSRVDDDAVYKILSAAKQQKVNVGVTLGEAKDTVGMILDVARRGGRAIDSLNNLGVGARERFKNARLVLEGHPSVKKRIGKVASDVLAVQLGWKPLIYDSIGYAEELARLRQYNPIRHKVVGSVSHRWDERTALPSYDWGLPAQRRERGIYSRKYVLYFTEIQVLSTIAQLGLTNPLSWAWELTPLSFVVDWFINVGRFIDLLDSTVGLAYEKGCTTSFEKVKVEYKCVGSGTYAGGKSFGSFRGYKEHVDVRRTVLSGFPSVPPPTLVVPKLGLSRGTTAVALITAALTNTKVPKMFLR